MLTFYDCPYAPSPRRAWIALAEKGLEFETVTIHLMEGEQFSEDYRRINPQCTVPALKLEDGTVLTDNAAILAYIDAEYPDPPLLGTTPLERAEVASWNARCEFEGLLAIAEALRNSTPKMKGRALPGPESIEQIPELAERGRKRLHTFWDTLERWLEGREFVATDRFTAADITALVTVDFARVIRELPSEKYTNIWRWREAMDERDTVQA